MAISTYGDLRIAITNWLDRSDQQTLDQIPNFINFAEKELYRNLRIPQFEGGKVVKLKDGAFSIPTNLIEFKHVIVPKQGLLTATSIEEVFRTPLSFCRIVDLCYVSEDVPNGTDLNITYYIDQKELENDSDNNALLTTAPELLLYTALKHAAIFVRDEEDVQQYAALAQGSYQQLVQQMESLEYSGSPLVITSQDRA